MAQRRTFAVVGLGRFAMANRGRFRALDLNPIIVRRPGEGALAVDIAVEPHDREQPRLAASAAE